MPYCCECGKEVEKNKIFCDECHEKIYVKNNESEIKKEEVKVEKTQTNVIHNPQHELISEVVPAKDNYDISSKELNKMDKGPWKVFAFIGYISGIISIFVVLVPFCFPISLGLAIEGLVFSLLGKKSVNHENKASTGISLCLATIFISILVGATCIMCTYECIKEGSYKFW